MNLILAPMHGMTDAFYRNTYEEIFGSIDTYYAPFIGTTKMRSSTSSVFKDIQPALNSKTIKLVPQLLSNHAEDFDFYASCIAKLGYKEINWNIGCPFHKVARKKKGSGILPHTELIREFLDKVCKNSSYDLSIKMRLGYEDKEEGIDVIQLFNDYPLKNITIHGRVGTQIYTGHVDLDAFEELYALSKHPIIYNGDINSQADYNQIQKRFPYIQDFMIGRGALSNPFLASAIKGINYSPQEKLNKLINFHGKIFDYYQSIFDSEDRLLSKMKEFWVYLAILFTYDTTLIQKIRQCRTLPDYHRIINNLFNDSTFL